MAKTEAKGNGWALFWCAWVITLVAKGAMSWFAPLMWDEGHFVAAGLRPDIGYPDIPAGQPLIAHLTQSLLGSSLIALRLPSLLIAHLLPLVIFALARASGIRPREAIWAAIASLILPSTAWLGIVFYPESYLQLLFVGMLAFGVTALRTNALWAWVGAGLCAAGGIFIHYRFAIPILGVGLFFLLAPYGQRHLTNWRLWVGLAFSLIGLAPTLAYNVRESFAPVIYHTEKRHNFAFFDDGLSHPLQQMSVLTPLAWFALLAAAIWMVRRSGPLIPALPGFLRRDDGRIEGEAAIEEEAPPAAAPWLGIILWPCGLIFALYTFTAPFNKAYLYHWPFMAYAPLLAFVPSCLDAFLKSASSPGGLRWRRALIVVGSVLPILGLGAAMAFIMGWANPKALPADYRRHLGGDFENWTPVADALRKAEMDLAAQGDTPVTVVVGHIPAVRVEFVRQGSVFVVPEADDYAKGFAELRARWSLDDNALLKTAPGRTALIAVIEPNYLYHQPEALDQRLVMCGLFEDIARIKRLRFEPGRLEVALYRAKVRSTRDTKPGFCGFMTGEYIAQPQRGDTLGAEPRMLYGIAAHASGVKKVEIWLNGAYFADAEYGLDDMSFHAPAVLNFDPNYPEIQWRFEYIPERWPKGRQEMSIMVKRADGSKIEAGRRWVYVTGD